MNDAILNESDIDNRLKNLEKNIRKRTFFDVISTFALIFYSPFLTFIIIFPFSLVIAYYSHENVSALSQRLFASTPNIFLIALFFYPFIAFIISTFIAFKRTHYKGFLWESLNETEFLLSGILLFSSFIFKIIIYAPLLLFCFAIIPVYVRNHLNKPLILKSFSSNYERDDLGIIMKQSLYVNEFADGYSSRPVFDNITEFIKNFGDENLLRKKIQEYARFLAQNGDLIAIDHLDNKLVMYLRTNMFQYIHFENPLTTIKKLRMFVNKENLTAISINLNDWEISFKLNEYDYKLLGNITYHQFSERILQQFTSSLNEFVKGNNAESERIINPPINHEIYYKPGEKPIYFIGIFYLMGTIIEGYSLLIISTPLSDIVDILAFLWPFILVNYLATNIIIGLILLFLVIFTSILIYKLLVIKNDIPRRS